MGKNPEIFDFFTRISATKATRLALEKAFTLNASTFNATKSITQTLCHTLRIGKEIAIPDLVDFLLQFDAHLTKLATIICVDSLPKLEKLVLLQANIAHGISSSYTPARCEISVRVSIVHLNDTLRAFNHEYGHYIDHTKQKAVNPSTAFPCVYPSDIRTSFTDNATFTKLRQLENELQQGETGKYYVVQGEKIYIAKSHFTYFCSTIEVIARSFDSYFAYLMNLRPYEIDVTDNLVLPTFSEVKAAIETHYGHYLR